MKRFTLALVLVAIAGIETIGWFGLLSSFAAVIKEVCNDPGCDYPGTQSGLQAAINDAAGHGWIIEVPPGVSSIQLNASPGIVFPPNQGIFTEVRTRVWHIGDRRVTPLDAPAMATLVLDYPDSNGTIVRAATTTSGTSVGYYAFRGIRFAYGPNANPGSVLFQFAPMQSAIAPGQAPTDLWLTQCLLEGNPAGFGPWAGVYLQAQHIHMWQNYITDIGNSVITGAEAKGLAMSTGRNDGDYRYNLIEGTFGLLVGGGGAYPNFPTDPVETPAHQFYAGNTIRLEARYRYRTYASDPHGLQSALPPSCATGQTYFATDTGNYYLCPNNNLFSLVLTSVAASAECLTGEFWKNTISGAMWKCTGAGQLGTFTATTVDANVPNAYLKNAVEFKKGSHIILFGNDIGPTFEQQVVSQFGNGTLINAIGCGQDGRFAPIRDFQFRANRYYFVESMGGQGAPGVNATCNDRIVLLNNVNGTFQPGEGASDGSGGIATVNRAAGNSLTLYVSGAAVGGYFTPGSTVTGATSGATGVVATITDAGPVFNQPPGWMSWKDNLAPNIADPRVVSGSGGSSGGTIYVDSQGAYSSSATGAGLSTNNGPSYVGHNTEISSAAPRLGKGAIYQSPSLTASEGIEFADNIFPYGYYGFLGSVSNGEGCANADSLSNPVLPNNFMINAVGFNNSGITRAYAACPGWQIPPSYAAVGFAADYSLTPASPYKGAAHDGLDPGADMNVVNCATATNATGAYNPYHDFRVQSIQVTATGASISYTAYGLSAPTWIVSASPNLTAPLPVAVTETAIGRGRVAQITGLSSRTNYFFRIVDGASGCYIDGRLDTSH